ncbi:MAG TPA: TIM-barrel domain-containing protein [Methylibium sp.]
MLVGLVLASASAAEAAPMPPGGYSVSGNSIVLTDAQGTRLRITPYGSFAVRLQAAREGEAFFPDDHYEMVESHRHGGRFKVQATDAEIRLTQPGGLRLHIDRKTLAVAYFAADGDAALLQETGGVRWENGSITRGFVPDEREHFTALGHGFFGRADAIDLKGQRLGRNYGTQQIDQAPLIVPFYISSRGYGVFLNSSFRNFFDFLQDGRYEFGIEPGADAGRMDYFVIAGPQPADVLRHYVELTGKPRLPPKAIFGLALSDKSHDHDSPTPSDEAWWKRQVLAHRAAGLPIDHLVNDNRWRAGGGKRCESRMEWDTGRFPDPAEYARWLKADGLVTTIDINRCVSQFSEGWKPAFNIPQAPGVDFASSAPDLTNAEFRAWFWNIFYRKALDPKLGYPGDALWIDEFDEMGAAPDSMKLASGQSFGEMRNYWFFLIAKALVQQGWDRSGLDRRPYVWVRGMTAGAQRYATLWSGDIKPNDDEMKQQVRGMQLAGLSGFPFWGHDAGGFYDWQAKRGPDASLHERWSMGWGSFSPIWKPHGMGPSRWPLDRTPPEQAAAARFARARYELMPYIYTAAHEAARTGLPMARALLLAYPQVEKAWRNDLEYLWGPDLLVAPNTDPEHDQEVWLPPGRWFDYWHPKQAIAGDSVVRIARQTEDLPVFVKAGAVLVKQPYALSTAFADKRKLMLDVYAGADGETTLVEDDDVTEDYRLHGRQMSTRIRYDDARKRLHVSGALGHYRGAPKQRAWEVTLHGPDLGSCYLVNGRRTEATQEDDGSAMRIVIASADIRKDTIIQACGNRAAARVAMQHSEDHK